MTQVSVKVRMVCVITGLCENIMTAELWVPPWVVSDPKAMDGLLDAKAYDAGWRKPDGWACPQCFADRQRRRQAEFEKEEAERIQKVCGAGI